MSIGSYVNHSGGCPGADLAWDIAGRDYGVVSKHYSFYNHTTPVESPVRLSHKELEEGYEMGLKVSKVLKRPLEDQMPYVKNLISRNWFQVKNSEAIFPVGQFMPANKGKLRFVDGGTGWAVEMAIMTARPVYFFDQPTKAWYTFEYSNQIFTRYHNTPRLTTNFAGIGTRKLNDAGLQAIADVYENTFITQLR